MTLNTFVTIADYDNYLSVISVNKQVDNSTPWWYIVVPILLGLFLILALVFLYNSFRKRKQVQIKVEMDILEK
jgi:H+/Cl- antiporter ClcA